MPLSGREKEREKEEERRRKDKERGREPCLRSILLLFVCL
jgi:hypothetical protein